MNDITYAVSVDVNNPIIPYNVYVASVLDSNVRYLEIMLYQNGNVIALSNTATATASLVTDNVLVNDSVECTISNNIISVPLEDLQRHGNLDVQVTVTEGTRVLAIPFPIQVRVTPNIAEEAQIDNDSLGSYAEVVREIAAARGDYPDLKDRLDGETDRIDDDISDINTALLGKANKAAAGSAGELAALDGNGALIRSGVSVAQIVGDGSTDEVPTTEAVRNALNDAEDTIAENIDWIFQGNSAYFPQLYFEQYFSASGSNYKLIYDDRDGERHVLFDFAQLPSAKGAQVFIGETEPSDPNIILWVDTSDGEPTPETTNPVTNLTGTATANSVTLSWQASSNAASYKIYQGDILIDSVTGTSYTINDLTADTSYTFGVVASGVGGDSLKVMLTIQTQQGGDLPAEYQQVEYVQPAGNANQINTGIQNADISKIEMGLFNDYSKYMKITGACDTADTWASGGGRPYIYKFEGDTPMRQVGYNTMTIDSTPSQYGGLSVYVDFVFSDITPNSSEVDVSDCFTFGNDINSDNNTNVARYYYVKIYNSDNDVIADYVPCYRLSDGKVGMYDLVRKMFYTPVNGEFIKGGDV